MSTIVTDYFTYTFVRMRGMVPLAGDLIRPMLTEGVSGLGYKWVGFGGEAKPIRTLGAVGIMDSLATMVKQQKSAQGLLCSVTDDFGITWTGLMVQWMEVEGVRPIVNGVGAMAGVAYLMDSVWVLQPTATSYSW